MIALVVLVVVVLVALAVWLGTRINPPRRVTRYRWFCPTYRLCKGHGDADDRATAVAQWEAHERGCHVVASTVGKGGRA